MRILIPYAYVPHNVAASSAKHGFFAEVRYSFPEWITLQPARKHVRAAFWRDKAIADCDRVWDVA